MERQSSPEGLLERIFKIRARNSSVRAELLAGLTTFVAIGYVIFVNPNILHDAGVPREAAIAATLWSTVFATVIMGLWANFPVAVAPGMGLNAFFTYTVVLGMGLSWQTALGAVFISGIVFLILTLGGIRQAIIAAVPMNLKYAIVVGIGAFIAFVGMQGSGIIVDNPATLVGAGHIANIQFERGKPAPLMTLAGLLITGILMARKVNCALLIGIGITTLLGMAFGACPPPESLSDGVSLTQQSLSGTFMAMDLKGDLQ